MTQIQLDIFRMSVLVFKNNNIKTIIIIMKIIMKIIIIIMISIIIIVSSNHSKYLHSTCHRENIKNNFKTEEKFFERLFHLFQHPADSYIDPVIS